MKNVFLGAITAIALAGCNSTPIAAKKAPAGETLPEHAPGELLVRFKPGVGEASIATVNDAVKAKTVHAYRNLQGLRHVRLAAGTSVEEALAAYRADSRVLYAEPNWVVSIGATPNDPRYPELWGMNNSGQTGGTPDADINAPEAWDLSTGSATVHVVVIDTGVDYTHQDLAANAWVNPGETAGNGIDDDGNGYVDDVHGVNTITGSGDPLDDHDHGSHCSGTIGGVGNNATGVAGVNWTTKIIGCKFLSSAGSGSIADAVECMDYVYALKTRPVNPVDITLTSNSWSGGGFSQAFADSLGLHLDEGILFVGAAGNSNTNNDLTPSYPSGYYLPNVIAVAATDHNDLRASFSSYGRRTVHIGAPGVDVLSTTRGNTYQLFSGTSMATPHVAGLAALLKAQDPARSWSTIRNLVLSAGTNAGSMSATTVARKRLRAADAGGAGSLTCTNQVLQERVRPIPDTVSVAVGSLVDIAAINANCGTAIGNLVLQVNGGASTFTLQDDGAGFDQRPMDGVASGRFPAPAGTTTLTFPNGEVLTVIGAVAYDPPCLVSYAPRSFPGTATNLTDDSSILVTPPFPITYAGATYPQVRIGANGALTFTGSGIAFSNTALPTASQQTFVAPFWDDLNPTTAGDVFYETLGVAPNRELVIEWRGIPHFGNTDPLTFQVVFFEGSSNMLYTYTDVTAEPGVSLGASATVGAQVNGTLATQYSAFTPSLADSTTLLWRLAGTGTPGSGVASAPTFAPGPYDEGSSVDLTTAITDTSGATSWDLQWDFDYDGFTFTPDLTQAVTDPQGTPILTTWNFAQDGTFTIAVRANVPGSCDFGAIATSTIDILNVLPTTSPITLIDSPIVEGSLVGGFESSFTDPGADSPWQALWDLDGDMVFDYGELRPAPGPYVLGPGLFSEDGTYTFATAVQDDDGLSNVESVTFTVDDVNPVVMSYGITGQSSVDEPASVSFAGDAVTGAADGVSDPLSLVEWDFDGDGLFEAASSEYFATHAYLDSGTYAATMRVWDEDSYTDAVAMVSVANVPPTAVAMADRNVTEGDTMLVQATATDPGADEITWSLASGPAGIQVNPSGAVAWSPSYAQSSRNGMAHLVSLSCDDGDGGTCSVSFTVFATVRDDDGDGMADTWEMANGMDPDANDAAGDVDGDGVSNLDEYNDANGGPFTPGLAAATAPLAGGEVESDDVTLRVADAADPDSGALTYSFSLSTSQAFATTLATATALEGSGGMAGFTSVVFDAGTNDPANGNDVALVDDGWYWWRARAFDEAPHGGPWSETRSLFYNPVNDPPTAPSIASPLDGNQVGSLAPTLVVGNSTDPDDTNLTITFRVYSDAAMTMEVAASSALPQGPFGTTSWPPPALQDNTRYWWRATASDGAALTNDSDGDADFFVNLGNNEPTVPVLSSPADGSILTVTDATLVVDNATDADGDALTYLFELDVSPTFNTGALQTGQDVPPGAGSTSYAVSGLSEDTTYWWRARASDGLSTGDWVMGSFRVNASNAPPSAPIAIGPAGDSLVQSITPTLRIANASDVEGDALTYSFEVRDSSDTIVASTTGVAEGASGETSWTIDAAQALSKGETYTWTATASDGTASGAASVATSFSVYKTPKGDGCGCDLSATAAGRGPRLEWFALVGVAVLVFRRRRE